MTEKSYGMYIGESEKVSLTVKFYFMDGGSRTFSHIESVIVEDNLVKMYTGESIHTMNTAVYNVSEWHVEIGVWS